VTPDEALIKLGQSTGEAVADVLRMFCPDAVEVGHPAVVPSGVHPLANIPLPAVAASVWYVDGVTGGNIFVMTRRGVQRLAAAMMGMSPDEVEPAEELSELELSAAGEAMNQMMSAAAAATSAVLGETVGIGPPETTFFGTSEDSEGVYELTPYMASVPFTVLGESCRLVQLVPNSFIVRMTRALTDMAAMAAGGAVATADGGIPAEALRAVPVRVWAELGRTRMPVGDAVSLPPGAVVDLDAAPDEPVQLYVNGRHIGSGRLILIDEEWAVRIDEICPGGPVPIHGGGTD
jgi:flagellar motor switch protein FliN/FliY